MHLPAAPLVARVFRLILYWKRLLITGSSSIGNGPSFQAHPVLDNSGAVISPLLANIYLHYAFDLWVQHWRKQPGRGEVIVLRYADDSVVGFEKEGTARRIWRICEIVWRSSD